MERSFAGAAHFRRLVGAYQRLPNAAVETDPTQRHLTVLRLRTLGGAALERDGATRESTSDPWGAPVNLGSNVNSVAVEAAPAISWDCTMLLFPSTRTGGLDLHQSTRTRGNGPD